MRNSTLTFGSLPAMVGCFAAFLAAPLDAQDSNGGPATLDASRQAQGAQDGSDAATAEGKLTPLAAKQQMIQDRFRRFQDRLFRLAEELTEREPRNAARLSRAISRAGQLGLSDKLDEIIKVLSDQSRLYDAAEAQGTWLLDADRLLGILLERDSDNQERREEIQRLEEYRRQVGELLEQQRKLRDAAAASKAAERMKRALERAIEQLEQMRRRQSELRGQSEGTPPPSLPSRQRQGQLAEESKQLAQRLEKLSEPGDGETEDEAQALNQARERVAEAAQSTESASKSMSQAEKDMESGRPKNAGGQQEQAEKALQAAQEKLAEARRALEENAQTGEQAGRQNALADKTQRLSQQMRQSSQSGGQQGGQPQGDKQGAPKGADEPTPGQENVERAESQMRQAGESLEEQKPDEALPKEEEAIEELQQAQKELEDRLEQLRKEEKEETLRDLESRFREMLAAQKPINAETLALANLASDHFNRAEKLQLADLAARQRSLSQEAQKCLHILDEDGTTIAFPRVVEQLSQDMSTVADRLAAEKVGAITQTIENEIVATLEQLLEAVQKMQQESEQQQAAQQQADNGEPPLLPKSAELKLLRASQHRINTRTQTIQESVAEGAETPHSGAGGLKKLANRQAECMEIARTMRDRPE